jgi:hypothetical protein
MRYCRKAAKTVDIQRGGAVRSNKCNKYFRFWHFSDLTGWTVEVRLWSKADLADAGVDFRK